jgi:hypothetical protein
VVSGVDAEGKKVFVNMIEEQIRNAADYDVDRRAAESEDDAGSRALLRAKPADGPPEIVEAARDEMEIPADETDEG